MRRREKDAEVIITSRATNQASRLVKEFGAKKAIVHSDWIERSIKEGRALMEQDRWGGCLLGEEENAIPGDNAPDAHKEGDGGSPGGCGGKGQLDEEVHDRQGVED